MNRRIRKRRQRQRRVIINLTLLSLLLISSLTLYLVLKQTENGQPVSLTKLWSYQVSEPQPTFQPGDQVLALKTANISTRGNDLTPLHQEVGQIISHHLSTQDGQTQITYDIRYNIDQVLTGVLESDLRAIDTPYRLGETVAIVNGQERGEPDDGVINRIKLTQTVDQLDYSYGANFPNVGQLEQLTAADFIWIKELALREDYSASQNNAILQDALNQAKEQEETRLLFPKGRFLIGSQTPDKDYILLTSNVTLRGQDTTLVVDGSARWFGLATGPGPQDGLSNFAMTDLTIEAKDLKAGNQFILMANHGDNWQISNNRFILVHQISSHIFDLGGVQNATFTGNRFEGYAPELTAVTTTAGRSPHNFIAEVIQFDASSNNGEWDGGMLKAIDQNYDRYNSEPLISHNITVINNAFLPYINSQGELIAYGGSIGQHSSGVGQVTIINNRFSASLSRRFMDSVPESDRWLYEPIHIMSNAQNTIYDNSID